MNSLPYPSDSPGFRSVPRTGVIYVMHRAAQAGYGSDGQEWFNLGQGSPEVGELPGEGIQDVIKFEACRHTRRCRLQRKQRSIELNEFIFRFASFTMINQNSSKFRS